MPGLAWTAAIWAVTYAIIFALRRQMPGLRALLSRENLAVMIALLGTFSIAGQTDTEEVLRNPVILERVLRGALSALAVVMAAPLLINRLRGGGRAGRRATAALVVYGAIALISTLYSAAPLVTAAKAFELGAGLVAVLAVVYGPEPRARLRNLLLLVILAHVSLVVVGVVGFFVIPDVFGFLESRPGFVSLRTLSPPYAHSNGMSSMSAIVGTYSIAQLLTRSNPRWLWAATSITGMIGLVLASGRQGLAMFVVGVAIVLWVVRRRLLVVALGPAVIALVWAYWDVILTAITRDRPDNFVTLTGRLGFWEAAVETWTNHMWTGFGYGSGGRFVVLESLGRGGISSLHSGYFEILTGVGILGAIPLLYALVRVVRWSLRMLAVRADVSAAVLIFPLMLRTGVSLGFGGWLTTELMLFAILAALADEDLHPESLRPGATHSGLSLEKVGS